MAARAHLPESKTRESGLLRGSGLDQESLDYVEQWKLELEAAEAEWRRDHESEKKD